MSPHPPIVRAGAGLLAATLLAMSSVAGATPSYPERLQDELDMPCAPPCTVCHRTSDGGVGTVTQPFGMSMVNNGLVLKKPEFIAPVLDILVSDSIDSDGDGTTDVDELSEGGNPNAAGSVLCATYGCGAHIAPATPDRPGSNGRGSGTYDLWPLLVLLALGLGRRPPATRVKRK